MHATLRQLSRAETIEVYSRLWNLEYPESPRAEEDVAAMFHHVPPGAFEEAWALVVGDEIVGLVPVADTDGANPVERVEVDVLVNPEFESLYPQGVELFETIGRRSQAKKGCIWTHDRQPTRLELLAQRGFEAKQTVPASMLEVAAFDPAPFQETLERVQQTIRLTSVKQLTEEGVDWERPLYEMNWEIAQDIPSPHPPSQLPFEQFQVMIHNPKTHPPQTMFVALDGEKFVGYSRVTPSLIRPDLAATGMSGVVRSHRRQGIVTALKVHGIAAMRELGIKWLQTDNDETNPMYDLNLHLGFKPRWKWIQFVKEWA